MEGDQTASAIDALLRNSTGHTLDSGDGELHATPSRGVAVVACMDARLDVGRLLGLETGEAHVIRNAGGIVTDDVLRSLTLSQYLLGTREVMLIHHTDCGMSTFTDTELEERIANDTGTRPGFTLGAFTDLEASVRESMARVSASPFLRHTRTVRGFVYEIETGRLREVS